MKNLLVIFFACICVRTFAQNPLYKRFFKDNSIITGAIYDIHQDERGFIWLATESGLMRFDGRAGVSFSANSGLGRAVTNILEDFDGNIYCQNFSGQFFKTSERNNSLHLVKTISNYGNIKQANIVSDSFIAYVDIEAISFYNLRTKLIKKIPVTYGELQPSYKAQKTNFYTVIFPNLQQLIRYSPDLTRTVKNFRSKNVVFYHVNVAKNDLILGKRPPYVIENIDTRTNTYLKEINSSTIINGITTVDNNIAVLTSNGVYLYSGELKFKRHLFAKESISSFIKDKQNNYWFGTLNNGLILVSQPSTISLLNEKHFTTITFKNDDLLAGTNDNEIYEINTARTESPKLIYKDSTIHEVRDIYYNHALKELIFSNQQLNIQRNGKTHKIITSVNDINPVNNKTYLLSEGGSVSFFPLSLSDSLFKVWFDPNEKLYNNRRLALLRDNRRVKSSVIMNAQKVISATSDGLIEINPQTHHQLLFKNEKIKAISLAKIDRDSLLIATKDNGILLYTNDSIHEYIKHSELSSNDIYMLKVAEKKIFIVTYTGLEVFNNNKQKIAEQYIADGYHGCDLVDFVFKNDKTYIANANGIIISPLHDYQKNNFAPDVYITKTSVNGVETELSAVKELDYNPYYFDFSFSVIDYRGLETTKAYYKVNDGEWILTTENRILLTSLEPNTYTIQLKAVNARGIETSEPAVLYFTIKPPLYRTWWFITVLFAATTILIYLLFRLRINTIKKQNTLLTEKMELESELQKLTLTGIKAQMNPHFIFNALNTIQSYIYLNDKKAAGDYLVSFSELTRHILEMSSRDKIYLQEEINALNLYLKLEKMRFEEDLNYEINTEGVISENVMIPSMLIQPYVENAIKHGLLHKKGWKFLQILFQQEGNNLIVQIIDNGIGIDASQKINETRNKIHKSFASEANKKRIEILNSNTKGTIGVNITKLKNEHGQSNGTKVVITIPTNR